GFACAMAADAALAHRVALQHAGDIGLRGLVAEVEGRLVAYTLGYSLSDSVFCILFEIADRDVRGWHNTSFESSAEASPVLNLSMRWMTPGWRASAVLSRAIILRELCRP